MTIDIWELVEEIHRSIDPAKEAPYQYLTLVCTGAYGECWAASFDFNLDLEWYELKRIINYRFAARGTTAAEAIGRAAQKVVEATR